METIPAPSAPIPTTKASDHARPTSRPSPGRPSKKHGLEASREAKRLAAGILEVLAGVRTPAEAASGLGISTVRYYLLEDRALAGLVLACESRLKGPGSDPEREAIRLRKTIRRLERDVQRHQALVRAAQRTVGLAALAAPKTTAKPGRRRRRPTVRALRAVVRLKAESDRPPVPAAAGPGT